MGLGLGAVRGVQSGQNLFEVLGRKSSWTVVVPVYLGNESAASLRDPPKPGIDVVVPLFVNHQHSIPDARRPVAIGEQPWNGL